MSTDSRPCRAPAEVAVEAGGSVDVGGPEPQAGRRDRSGGKRIARRSDGMHNAVQHGVYVADAYSTRAYLKELEALLHQHLS